ncbi:MAG: hypothetical protein BM556_15425 [Bacteriovorax sp. MedPE-SWde]|nr:MAG: hypothetical protein BM556_15425 [Bacteriovorax sp. MedPE-SWde]
MYLRKVLVLAVSLNMASCLKDSAHETGGAEVELTTTNIQNELIKEDLKEMREVLNNDNNYQINKSELKDLETEGLINQEELEKLSVLSK